MIFRKSFLELIRAGKVKRAYRRWARPAATPGSTLHTPVGLLAIVSVSEVDPASLTERDARAAGHADLAALLKDLRPSGTLYRINLRYAGPDPRLALRAETPTAVEACAIADRIRAWPWARPMLELLSSHPGVRAGDLAPRLGLETLAFKTRTRRLKALGLTISLGTGYRLSPRGLVVLKVLRRGR